MADRPLEPEEVKALWSVIHGITPFDIRFDREAIQEHRRDHEAWFRRRCAALDSLDKAGLIQGRPGERKTATAAGRNAYRLATAAGRDAYDRLRRQ